MLASTDDHGRLRKRRFSLSRLMASVITRHPVFRAFAMCDARAWNDCVLTFGSQYLPGIGTVTVIDSTGCRMCESSVKPLRGRLRPCYSVTWNVDLMP